MVQYCEKNWITKQSENVCQLEEADSYSGISLCFFWYLSKEKGIKQLEWRAKREKKNSSSKEEVGKWELCGADKRRLQQREFGHRADLGLHSRIGEQ